MERPRIHTNPENNVEPRKGATPPQERGEELKHSAERASSTPLVVLGASGLVGSRLTELTGARGMTSADVDIRDRDGVMRALEPMAGMHVVNCAAYTDVDGAEKQRMQKLGTVWQINVVGAQNVAEACKEHGIFMIHVSTDFVFPGTVQRPGPYKETAALPKHPDNIGWYGWTKRMAEKVVMDVNPDSAVVRISYPYGPHSAQKPDFAGRFLIRYDKGQLVGPRDSDTMTVFGDQIITPTYIDEAVKAISKIAERRVSGIYHVASRNGCAPHEFARQLIKLTRGDDQIPKRGSMSDFLERDDVAPRPQFGGLNTQLTRKRLGIRLMTWKEALQEYADALNNTA